MCKVGHNICISWEKRWDDVGSKLYGCNELSEELIAIIDMSEENSITFKIKTLVKEPAVLSGWLLWG